tara:strand:+ start:98 stop:298 length:201 start_codon:yes stop_codon:yes gene_type:complete
MASKLKSSSYHRAGALGDGSFGSVMIVYNDLGVEFAQKVFDEVDEEDEGERVNERQATTKLTYFIH